MYGRGVRLLVYEGRHRPGLWCVGVLVDNILYDWCRPLFRRQMVAGCCSGLGVRSADWETGSVDGVRISMWSIWVERHVDACGQLKAGSKR